MTEQELIELHRQVLLAELDWKRAQRSIDLVRDAKYIGDDKMEHLRQLEYVALKRYREANKAVDVAERQYEQQQRPMYAMAYGNTISQTAFCLMVCVCTGVRRVYPAWMVNVVYISPIGQAFAFCDGDQWKMVQ